MKRIKLFEEFIAESEVNEAKDVKSEVIDKLSQFFGVSTGALIKFNFDGKDDIKALTKALNGTNYEGVDNIVRVAVKAAKRDLGVDEFKDEESINEGAVKQFEADIKEVINQVKRGMGWIDPSYIEETWNEIASSVDFSVASEEIVNRLIKAGIVYQEDGDGEKGKQAKNYKEISSLLERIGDISEGSLNEKLDLKLSTNEYPKGIVARFRLESDEINLRKVAYLSRESWSDDVKAFTDNELGFESADERKTAMLAIQKDFDNGLKDMREFALKSEDNRETLVHKYNPAIEIELIEPTNKGWKVYQIEKGKKKIAYFNREDIKGDNALFIKK